jgi:GNAT superfamily N-acetyltransferase
MTQPFLLPWVRVLLAAITGCDNGRWLTIFIREEAGEIVAGLHGWTWGRTGFVQTLWVREDLRGRGLGAKAVDDGRGRGRAPGLP